uniref:Type II and III secretion system protein n=1 Tax=Solibacter usitatus (strain Ellin6076) TaxID=234267 RepID=Q01NT3_SOLUE
MRRLFDLRLVLTVLAASAVLSAQPAPSRIFPPPAPEPQQPTPQQPQPQQQPQQPGTPGQPPATQPQNAPATNAPRLTDSGAFIMPNASLTEMIDLLAKRLKINYILDPAVRGTVSIFTYGEVKPVDYMPLLETILRVNGDAMVKVGDMYRIVPVNRINQLPIQPMVNVDPKTLPDDERMIMNLIFLKYATASEIANLIKPFLGEGAYASTYEAANLLILEDNSRNMRRTMELIGLFDSDQFAGQRVRLFEVENSRPSDLQKELEQVFKAYALSEKGSGVKFIPVDRINTIIAVAPNPGIFTQVEQWIGKLDIAVKASAGAVNSYVYRLKYSRAETVAMAIMALYSGNPMALMALGAMASNMNGGMNGGSMYGMNGTLNSGAMGMGGAYSVMGQMGGGYPGMYSGMQGQYGPTPLPMAVSPMATQSPAAIASTNPADQTGMYLGNLMQPQNGPRVPHVIPNPFDNTILIQGTPQEYEQILGLLRQLDIAPRQVLIDAKIYEVDLNGAFAAGVSAYLDKKDTGPFSRTLNAATGAGGLTLTTGALVLRSHELLAALTASETASHSKVISAPSIIATDSVPATLNVGDDVPVLTSQAVAGGVQSSGSSVFTNTVSNRSTGVTLSIMARVNSSGIVTLIVNQNVSSPQPPPANSAIQSPSFSNRSFQTQLTVQDGDTVAIGGIILESNLQSSAGVPFLHRLPGIGAAFGAKSYTKSRTELVVFLTPRVIYDTNQMVDATDEIRSGMKRINRAVKNQ